MPARKMRIELSDNEGNRYTISFEGRVTREKTLRLLDLVELLGGVPTDETDSGSANRANQLSKYDKTYYIIKKYFPLVWFSSKEAQSVYEQELKEPANLSTISTYLSRMVGRGMLVRKKVSGYLKYRMASTLSSRVVKQKIHTG